MKKLIFALLFSIIAINVSAQTKIAYCDIYLRGGGRSMKATIMFDNRIFGIGLSRTNIGDILNTFAKDGWVLDREIVIPRHPLYSTFTRHKLHLIMKKEYKDGENPFHYFDADTSVVGNGAQTTSFIKFGDKIVYNNINAVVINISGHKVVLALDDFKNGTWHEAMAYSENLGDDGWYLPTSAELASIMPELTSVCWTATEVSEKRALTYDYMHGLLGAPKDNANYRIMPIKIVNVSELE